MRGWPRVAGLCASVAVLAACAAARLIPLPPPEFRANAFAVVRTVSDASSECGGRAIACYRGNTIIALNPCLTTGWYAEALCDEFAHVQGYKHPTLAR